ncbi:MAG TPA: DNA polymerase IV [Candidatus Sulfotelmatobacter sp.]|nr:DNA polymerase IV [Candidatus Sulfotelmatobacter sp.]
MSRGQAPREPGGPGRRWIIHVDMDAFYAAVEQLDHPEYRGKPVIVGADPQGGKGRGVVSACSYEARRFGVRSALPISQAYRLCPGAIYVRPRMERYEEMSRRVFAVLRSVTDLVEPLSIDEAFLDVTGSQKLFGDAETIGRRLKARIQEATGLVASVGIAPNKFLAKIASDLGKPDGFVVVPHGGEAAFLRPLPLFRLWGVGPKTEARLARLGLRTIGDLAAFPRPTLEDLLGEAGGHLADLAHGVDDREVVPWEAAKSIGAETTFGEDTDDPERLRETLLALADRVAHRLRDEGYRAGTVTLKYRDSTFTTLTRAMTLGEPTDVSGALYRAALALLERVPRRQRKVRLLGVSASRLLPAAGTAEQLSLFGGRRERSRSLERAVDAIRERFGEDAIRRAALAPAAGAPENAPGPRTAGRRARRRPGAPH